MQRTYAMTAAAARNPSIHLYVQVLTAIMIGVLLGHSIRRWASR